MNTYQNQLAVIIENQFNFEIDETYDEGETITVSVKLPNNQLVWFKDIETSQIEEFIYESYKDEFNDGKMSEDELFETVLEHYSIDNSHIKDFIIEHATEYEYEQRSTGVTKKTKNTNEEGTEKVPSGIALFKRAKKAA